MHRILESWGVHGRRALSGLNLHAQRHMSLIPAQLIDSPSPTTHRSTQSTNQLIDHPSPSQAKPQATTNTSQTKETNHRNIIICVLLFFFSWLGLQQSSKNCVIIIMIKQFYWLVKNKRSDFRDQRRGKESRSLPSESSIPALALARGAKGDTPALCTRHAPARPFDPPFPLSPLPYSK